MFHFTNAPWVLALLLLPSALAADGAHDTSSLPRDDETALIQHSLHMKDRKHKAFAVPPQELHPRPPAGSLVHRLQELGSFNCNAYPSLCKSPFNCHEVTSEDVQLWLEKGAAWQGVPNYKLWCAVPHYEAYASRCAAGDLDGAGKLQFHLTTSGLFGPLTKEMDGSACFVEGHCANSKVTNRTSINDAVNMCDERFGREAWATWGSVTTPLKDLLDYNVPSDLSNGYQNREQTRPSVLAACAMGNFHCDVQYCRETYCKEDYYVKKYGHLSS